MSGTNIVALAPALQRRRARQGDHESHAVGQWLVRYPDGIDGLWTAPRAANAPSAVILPFRPREHSGAKH